MNYIAKRRLMPFNICRWSQAVGWCSSLWLVAETLDSRRVSARLKQADTPPVNQTAVNKNTITTSSACMMSRTCRLVLQLLRDCQGNAVPENKEAYHAAQSWTPGHHTDKELLAKRTSVNKMYDCGIPRCGSHRLFRNKSISLTVYKSTPVYNTYGVQKSQVTELRLLSTASLKKAHKNGVKAEDRRLVDESLQIK